MKPQSRYNVSKLKWNAPPSGTKKDQMQDKQISNIKKKIKKIEYNEEVKYVDVSSLGAVPIPETGLQLSAGGIAQAIERGDDPDQRDGNEIVTTSLLFKADIRTNTAKLTPSRVRCVVYWDSQANGAVNVTSGTANSLMEASGLVDGTLDMRNQETIDRFTILMDKVYTLNPQLELTTTAGTVTANQPVSLSISKRFRLGRKIQYSGTGNGMADLVKNNICVVLISDSNTNPPTCSSILRLYFKDT